MRLLRSEIEDLAKERGFRADMLESMVRLYDVLDSFASDDVIAPRMALKGGTALSAFHAELPRLSFDIDINYVGDPDDMGKFEDRVVAILQSKGYRTDHAPSRGRGKKWTFGYLSTAGTESSLFMDFNYRERFPLFGISRLSSVPLGEYRARDVPVLDVHEIAGSKLKALIARQKSRDLFDADVIIGMPGLDWQKVRLTNVVHGAWQETHDWRDFSSAMIGGSVDEVLRNLELCLPKGYFEDFGGVKAWLEGKVLQCRDDLAALYRSTESERAFLDAYLDEGRVDAGLLTPDPETRAAIEGNPSICGKAAAIREGRFTVISRVEQDRRRADIALQLASAATERMRSTHSYLWGDLHAKMKQLLEFADGRQQVPMDAVDALAFKIARKRAETDLRLAAVRQRDGAPMHEFRARFSGDPRFSRRDVQAQYEAFVDEGRKALARDGVAPTSLESAAARLEVAAKGTRHEARAGLLAPLLELGSVAEPAEIRAEREALPSELAAPMKDLTKTERVRLLERAFRAFTVHEMQQMSAGQGPLLAAFPDDAARSGAAENLKALLLVKVSGPAPWRTVQSIVAEKATGIRRDSASRFREGASH